MLNTKLYSYLGKKFFFEFTSLNDDHSGEVLLIQILNIDAQCTCALHIMCNELH